jgi:hypothetical protein
MLTWYAQELPSSCVSACVRMVLGGLGQYLAEPPVRRLLGHAALGISLVIAQTRLAQAGADAAWHEAWNLDDLRDAVRQGRHPIVGVERQPLGYPRAFHALVVVSVTSATVTVLDPLDGPEPRDYGSAAFMLAWELAGREALVIATSPRLP